MQRLNIYAPLSEFEWKGRDFEMAPEIWIRRFEEMPHLHGQDASLAADEKSKLFFASHWITFPWTERTVLCPTEIVNLLLLAIWLLAPTKTHVAFRFHLDATQSTSSSAYRLLDRFQWIQGFTTSSLTDSDVTRAAQTYRTLLHLARARGRMNDALLLALAGCWSNRWQVALICYAAATEAILTYSTGGGLTRRLAKSYACLVETDKAARDTAYLAFKNAYESRSDVMHGRTHNVADADRLPTLAIFAEILRNLFAAVVASPSLAKTLEDTDAQREVFFSSIEIGYTPP